MPNPREIREDIRARLLATGAFAEVWLTGTPEQWGRSAAVAGAAALPPGDGEARTKDDDGYDDITIQSDERLVVTILARAGDQDACVARAEAMLQHLKDAVNGRSLAGMTVPHMTLVRSWKYQDYRAPEQRIRATVAYAYLQMGYASADTTPAP